MWDIGLTNVMDLMNLTKNAYVCTDNDGEEIPIDDVDELEELAEADD